MKVLVAEDDRATRAELESVLVSWGYDVALASDGEEARAILGSEDAPPLVVLDWMMPEVDGIQVCRELRESSRPGSTYVILLTVKDRREDIVEGFRVGADDYITKPFDHDTLRSRVTVGSRMIRYSTGLNHEPLISDPIGADGSDEDAALGSKEILDNFGGDAELFGRIAAIFVKSASRQLYDMRDALARGDSEALWRSAHSLKGSVGYFSKDAALRLALRLEMIGRSGQLARAHDEALEAEMVRLKSRLVAVPQRSVS